MLPQTTKSQEVTGERPAHWGAVVAMSLCVFALIASEFMPVSLLTPIAGDLHVTEGQAGQAVAVSGAFGVLASLFTFSLARRLDRKILLLILTCLMAVSGAIVAFASNYLIFMSGRALIGIVIGGFWSLSAAVAMRLVPSHQVPRALAIFNGGNALATVIAPPLGSYLGSIIGWRGAFFTIVPFAVIVLIWQAISLPPMKPETGKGSGNAFALFRKPIISFGMASVGIFFVGQFALFTFIRPFLETVTRVDVKTLSIVLLIIGVAGFIGTSLIGLFLKRNLYATLIAIPLVMAVVAVGLIAFGSNLSLTIVLFATWGLIATAAPVGWWTWLARTLPDDVEAGGGLMVAMIQLSITLGATVGGLLYDAGGYRITFSASAILLLLAGAAAFISARAAKRSNKNLNGDRH